MSAAGAEADSAQALRRERLGYVVAGVLALVPLLRMVDLVRGASVLQYSDYWLLVDHYTQPDGGLRLAGLFEFQYQNHPVVIPIVVYWLNSQLFDGSNVALGGFVLAVGVGILAVVGLALARSPFRPVDRMVLLVLASALVFTPNGAWNYGIAMSGTAWLGAGLVGIVAVYLRSRDRPVLAFAMCVLAVLTYATGLMVWPGVAAAGACRREVREWWRELPFVVGFVATYVWFGQVQTTGLEATVAWPSLADGGWLLLELLAFPLGLRGTPAAWVGGVVLIAIVALVVRFTLVARRPEASVWCGIAVFGLLATLSLAFGRYAFIEFFGNENRYSSVPAVALIGLSGLVVTAVRDRSDARADARTSVLGWAALAAFGAMALAATATGGAHTRDMDRKVAAQELREVALHLGVADGTSYLAGADTSVTDLLREIGHHPFVEGWDLDCGLIDDRLEVAGDGPTAGQIVSSRHLLLLDDAVEITGRFPSDLDARCVVVTDADGVVIGAGTLEALGVDGTGPGTGATGFRAVARPGSPLYRTYVVPDGGGSPVLVGEVTADDIEPASLEDDQSAEEAASATAVPARS